jgi:hypothetical protein
MFKFFKNHNKRFDILEIDTWDNASTSKEIIWNNKKLLNKDNNPLTEKDAVDLSRSIFNFLERNGDILTLDKKITAIKNMLNRIENPEYYAKQYEQKQAEIDNNIPDGKFDPRDPETYKFAKNKPLIIDGVRIFNISYDRNDKKIKEDQTEKDFVVLLSALQKTQKNGIIWDTAVNLVKEDFINQGIKAPRQDTPGYMDKINEVYESILKNPNAELTKKQEKDYIEKYIKQKLAECSPNYK